MENIISSDITYDRFTEIVYYTCHNINYGSIAEMQANDELHAMFDYLQGIHRDADDIINPLSYEESVAIQDDREEAMRVDYEECYLANSVNY